MLLSSIFKPVLSFSHTSLQDTKVSIPNAAFTPTPLFLHVEYQAMMSYNKGQDCNIRRTGVQTLTSISLSVIAVHCLSWSLIVWKVDDRHSPLKPMPSRTSSSISAVSTPPENFGLEVKVRSNR